MKDRTTAELLFRWVCLVLVYSVSVDSLNWTAQPANPTELIKGQDVSLTWNFSLTANEQADRQSYYSIVWRKFNPSSAIYDAIASRVFVQVIGTVQYAEPQAPHIVVGRAEANDSATLQIKKVQSDDEGRYKIEYSVKISGPPAASQEFNLTVLVPSEIANVSSDQVVCEGSMVTLRCNATGKPTPSITWTRVFDNGTDSAPLLPVVDGKYVTNNVMRSSDGTYRCTADNGVGDPVNRTVRVTVRYSASVVRIVNSSNTVNEGGSFNMTCNASGDPNVHWIKVDNGQRIDGNILNFTNINRNDAGQYRCEAENDCGRDSRVQSIEVYFGPSATGIGQNITVGIGKSQSFGCPVDGNPEPTITWYNASGTVIYSGKTLNIPSTKLSDTGCYTCSAKNFLGTVNITHCLVVELVSSTATSPSTASPTTSKKDSSVFKGTSTIRDKDWNNPSDVKDVEENFCKVVISDVSPSIAVQLNGAGIEDCKVENTRDGSIIVDFVLRFNQSVSDDEVVAALKAAAEQGNFGSYNVDPESIKRTPSPTKEPWPCKDSLFKDKKCDLKVHIVAIFGSCGALLVIVCAGGGTYYIWVHKKKKCRKDPRIHNSDDDQEALQGNQSGVDENAYSQVNGGYADSGPPSVNGTGNAEQQPRAGANGTYATVQHQQQQQQQVQGAPPTKFTKKQKREEEKRKKEEEKKMKEEEKRMKEEEKKNKNDAENIPQYAVVDKSLKKKKKEVVEDAYAQVDMSKKSKKKPKPGETLYADLDDFQRKDLPAVSTSPGPLPAVKMPPAYGETQYADITQFLKGDATLPDTNNSQGTEMTYANVEGGKGKPKDTAKEGGNEEKPNETANEGGNEGKPKETRM